MTHVIRLGRDKERTPKIKLSFAESSPGSVARPLRCHRHRVQLWAGNKALVDDRAGRCATAITDHSPPCKEEECAATSAAFFGEQHHHYSFKYLNMPSGTARIIAIIGLQNQGRYTTSRHLSTA
jgi:hypothetical protein